MNLKPKNLTAWMMNELDIEIQLKNIFYSLFAHWNICDIWSRFIHHSWVTFVPEFDLKINLSQLWFYKTALMPIFMRLLICPLYQGQAKLLYFIVYQISYDKCEFQNYKNRPSTNRSSKMWVSIKHTYRLQLDFIIKISSGQFDQFMSTSVG